MAALYFSGAALVCIVNILQWIHIKYRVKSVQFHKTKLMMISLILFVSYIIRGIMNISNLVDFQKRLQCYSFPNNYLW